MAAGLRERKKQQTRQAIHEAAMRLFAERGYDATTIADIAEAAGISPRTFFSYFTAKEEAVFQKFDMAYEEYTHALQNRPAGMTALAALREWIIQEAHKYTPTAENLRLEAKLREESPAVAACELRHNRMYEARLAEAVAEDLGEPADSLRPRLVAAAAMAALQVAGDKAEASLDENPDAAAQFAADPMAFLDDALRFLDAGLAALRA
jgi:TetR/AcrR family transcriptional regulator, regulator of mycofactocin system